MSGVLERTTQPSPTVEITDQGGETSVPIKPPAKKTGKRIKGHTVYLPDDLFERILVASHRRDKTISEYLVAILERQVPDHRTRVEPVGLRIAESAIGPIEQDGSDIGTEK